MRSATEPWSLSGTIEESSRPRLKAFIIHLKRAVERRPQVERLVAALPIPAEIVDAVDGECLDVAEAGKVYRPRLHNPRYPFRLSKSEIACFLSHRKAWQAIVDQELDAGFVVEDDVELDEFFPRSFASALACLEPEDFVRFPFRADREAGPELFNDGKTRIIAPSPVGLGMVAQLVGRSAARHLLAATQRFDRPVDTTVQMKWVTGVAPKSVVPGGVHEISRKLGGSMIRRKKTVPDKLRHEILRPLYRIRIAIRSRR
ncbi:glycosyltransferase family 25 protein [Chelativorans alearense]|uniref:glycosyltransferase family 25 protein n=1 Tax=Chelativorans alearense TaxID=2681495 RepID=UPI0013D26AE5|nr:glycosyltransferase family 25 protein [Chelativorans alearense]